MGAWGVNAFENDTALDWVYDLEDATDISILAVSLEPQLSEPDYLDSGDACVMLAAAETIAALAGKPARDLPDEVVFWVDAMEARPDAGLLDEALAAIGRVLGGHSELAELWADSDSHDHWVASVEHLRTRLERLRERL